MGSQLKTPDGSVTVQVKGNGPLGAIVCVGDADGYVRGYLQDPSADLPLRADGKLDVGGGVGRGYLMVIKDIGLKDPVTGTVALVNGEIAEDLTRYFAESEQIPSACALGVLVDTDRTVKCAGGWLVQLMPGVQDKDIDRLEANLAKLQPMTAMLEQGMTLEAVSYTHLESADTGRTSMPSYSIAMPVRLWLCPAKLPSAFCSAVRSAGTAAANAEKVSSTARTAATRMRPVVQHRAFPRRGRTPRRIWARRSGESVIFAMVISRSLLILRLFIIVPSLSLIHISNSLSPQANRSRSQSSAGYRTGTGPHRPHARPTPNGSYP